jgi:ABC-type multidrug transport system ATPase subunit
MMETNTPEGKEEDESALAIKFGGPDDGEQTNLNLNEQNSSEDDEDAYAEEELEKPLPVRLRYDVSISVDDFRDKGTKKTLLSGAAGEAGPGDTLAVLGPSGSGKTTMLRVLSGRMVGYTGRVLLNEKSPTETTRNVLCFVQQEDLFIPSVTPREHLLFHARLRIENSIPVEEKIRRVNGLLAELGLKKCADTPIGGVGATVSGNISGGEKKRLSLATELLSRPSVIFADEVTSGLDSHMAETVVAKLRKLAQAGHTVLATIHQPSSYVFSGFNRVHLLSEGRTAYSGSAEAALEYFSSIGRPLPPLTNPADFYIKILSVGNTAAVLDAWEGSDFSKTLQLERLGSSRMSENRMSVLLKKQDFAAPWQLQFRELMRRTLLSYRRDAVLGRIRFAQALVLGTLVGAIYFHIGKSPISLGNAQSVNGALFYAILNQGLLGALGVIQVFPLGE